MWWKVTLLVVILMAVCFVLGLYVGGGVFLQLTGGDYSAVSFRTLFDARHLPLDDGRLIYLPWAWCITAALTFLPVGLTLLALLARVKPKQSLHGDARFANDRELRAFEYTGDYKKL